MTQITLAQERALQIKEYVDNEKLIADLLARLRKAGSVLESLGDELRGERLAEFYLSQIHEMAKQVDLSRIVPDIEELSEAFARRDTLASAFKDTDYLSLLAKLNAD